MPLTCRVLGATKTTFEACEGHDQTAKNLWTNLQSRLSNIDIFFLKLLDVLGFNATLTAKVISWRLVTHVFPGFLTPVLTQLSFESQQLLSPKTNF